MALTENQLFGSSAGSDLQAIRIQIEKKIIGITASLQLQEKLGKIICQPFTHHVILHPFIVEKGFNDFHFSLFGQNV